MDTYKLSFKVPKGKLGAGKFYTLKELTSNVEHKNKILDYIKKYYIVIYNNLEDPSTDLLSSDVIIHVQKNDVLNKRFYYFAGQDVSDNANVQLVQLDDHDQFQKSSSINLSLLKIKSDLVLCLKDPLDVKQNSKCQLYSKDIEYRRLLEYLGLDKYYDLFLNSPNINNNYDFLFRKITPEEANQLFILNAKRLSNGTILDINREIFIDIQGVIINDKYLASVKCQNNSLDPNKRQDGFTLYRENRVTNDILNVKTQEDCIVYYKQLNHLSKFKNALLNPQQTDMSYTRMTFNTLFDFSDVTGMYGNLDALHAEDKATIKSKISTVCKSGYILKLYIDYSDPRIYIYDKNDTGLKEYDIGSYTVVQDPNKSNITNNDTIIKSLFNNNSTYCYNALSDGGSFLSCKDLYVQRVDKILEEY